MTEIKTISYDTAKDFLLPRHYSGRIPSISYAYGCYNDGNLVGVLTVGKGFVHKESDLTPVDSNYIEWFKSSVYYDEKNTTIDKQ